MNVTPILENTSPTAAPRRKWRRAAITAISGLTLAGIAAVAHFSRRDSGSDRDLSADAARQQARMALTSFLAAGNNEARASWIIDGGKLLPIMEAWYAAHETDSLSADHFIEPRWTFNAPLSDVTALEFPRDRGRPPVVACFKRAESGKWLLDWEIWTQSLDLEFRNFIHKPAEGERTLRARLTREGSGDDMTVTVADPFDAAQSLSFDITRPDLRALYSRDLPIDGSRTAAVQLVWLNDALTGTLTPSIRRHLCWGFPGLDGKEPAGVEVTMASKHRPPPGTDAVPSAALAAAPTVESAVKVAVAPAASGALSTRPPAAATVVETAKK